MRRQNEHARLRLRCENLARSLQAIQLRHREIENGDVGFVCADLLDGLPAVADLGDDRSGARLCNDRCESLADQLVVVCDDDAGSGLHVTRRSGLAATG